MGTKNDPGDYDCYANAEPDEPMFILLGRDPAASATVEAWRSIRAAIGKEPLDSLKSQEAHVCAKTMAEHAALRGKGEEVSRSRKLFVNDRVAMAAALAPLVAIADSVEAEMKREGMGSRDPSTVDIAHDADDKVVLTLAHCFAARKVMRGE